MKKPEFCFELFESTPSCFLTLQVALTLSYIMMKDGQTLPKNLAV